MGEDSRIWEKVHNLLDQMTLEEKVAQMDMIRGVEFATKSHPAFFTSIDPESDFYWDDFKAALGGNGIGFIHDSYSSPQIMNRIQKFAIEQSRLGIPAILTGEALHGISYPGATIFPMPIAMGASFDRELTEEIGAAIAAETRSIGISEILAPNLDLSREPRWGRVEETFGEDTYLSSEMAYHIVHGEQGDDISAPDKVACEPKHYCVHAIPESGLNCSHARVGKREVESDYLPVFDAGIRKAGAYNAMACYNAIDFEVVIASKHYLTDVLKDRIGLKGYVRADFGAVARQENMHHTVQDTKTAIERAVNAGLDVQGFDYPNQVWQSSLVELVREGRISEERINDAAGRVLYVKHKLGLFENPFVDETRSENVLRCDRHRDISYRMAQESAVLLKNDGILPLKQEEIKSIAVIGPSSSRQRVGSYSSVVYGYKCNSVYEELQKALGDNICVKQCEGCKVSERDIALLPQSWYQDGVHAVFYGNPDFDGEPAATEKYPSVNFNWILAKPHRSLNFVGYSARFTADFKVNAADFGGQKSFLGKLVFTTNDSVRLKVDGKLLIESWGANKVSMPCAEFLFEDGAVHHLEIEYVCDVNGANITLSVDASSNQYEEALELVRECDLTVFVGGDDTTTSGEGMDRDSIQLYGAQRKLLQEIGETGKPLVLVLEVGKAVDLSMESTIADAILVPWFGGEHGAKAICDILTGRISPSGKLPVSFPKNIGQLPVYYTRIPGGHTNYLDGEHKPLYPFGFGLSYTEFAYSDLKIEKKTGCEVTVSAVIENTGGCAGTEVVQLYVTDPVTSIVTPARKLQGFERVKLQPGEKKEVVFHLGFDSFKLLNPEYEWVVEPGEFIIALGSDSENMRLQGSVTL